MPINDAMTAVREAERRGFESAWIVESSLTPGKDAISYLGALAVSTERIKLATGVINIFSRSATLIASTMATLDEMSKGRMILGIGTGHWVMSPYHSVEFHDPLNRMREYIAVNRQLTTGSDVNFPGKQVNIRKLKLNIRPYRQRIPIYVATVSEKLARIAGEIADGVLLVLVTPTRLTELVKAAHEGAESVKRSTDSVDIACYLPTFFMGDHEKALAQARQTIAGYGRSKHYRRLYRNMGYSKEADLLKEAWSTTGMENAMSQVPETMVRDLVLVGSREDCIKRVGEYRRSGANLIVVQPAYAPADLDSNVRPCIDAFGS
jgi:alkanesulfonate monooxygenase SsuD/methylene tetrahydromethanopterin reductase-like flavin-dependent oxidoreductase (luciferase family)